MARALVDIGYHTAPQKEILHKHGTLHNYLFLLCQYTYYALSRQQQLHLLHELNNGKHMYFAN